MIDIYSVAEVVILILDTLVAFGCFASALTGCTACRNYGKYHYVEEDEYDQLYYKHIEEGGDAKDLDWLSEPLLSGEEHYHDDSVRNSSRSEAENEAAAAMPRRRKKQGDQDSGNGSSSGGGGVSRDTQRDRGEGRGRGGGGIDSSKRRTVGREEEYNFQHQQLGGSMQYQEDEGESSATEHSATDDEDLYDENSTL